MKSAGYPYALPFYTIFNVYMQWQRWALGLQREARPGLPHEVRHSWFQSGGLGPAATLGCLGTILGRGDAEEILLKDCELLILKPYMHNERVKNTVFRRRQLLMASESHQTSKKMV